MVERNRQDNAEHHNSGQGDRGAPPRVCGAAGDAESQNEEWHVYKVEGECAVCDGAYRFRNGTRDLGKETIQRQDEAEQDEAEKGAGEEEAEAQTIEPWHRRAVSAGATTE